VNVATVIATGVNAEGRREILGVDVFTAEDGAAWTTFLPGLVARGLSGVKLVTSDSHEGLKSAIAAVLPGAVWQRCRLHYADLRIMPTSRARRTQPALKMSASGEPRSTNAQPDP
jgi:putative transposase